MWTTHVCSTVYLVNTVRTGVVSRYRVTTSQRNNSTAIFVKMTLMPVISFLTSLTFWSSFYVISILFCPKTRPGPEFLKK